MQIVFVADNALLSKLIRYFTKRSWIGSARVSHVALRYGDEESKWMVEATAKHGFFPNWWPNFIQDLTAGYKFEVIGIDPGVLEGIIDECIDEFIEWRYDFTSIAGLIIMVIWYWMTGKKIKNPFGSKTALNCTESMYRIFKMVEQRTGIRFFEDHDPSTIFPEEQLEECFKTPERFVPVNQ